MRPRRLFALVFAVVGVLGWSCATGGGSGNSDDDDNGDPGTGGSAGSGGMGVGGEPSSSSTGGTAGAGEGGGGACTEMPCKIVLPQCGCPADQQCTVGNPSTDNPNGRFCEAEGTTPNGQACSASNKCLPGSMCVNTGGEAICLEFCANDTSCDAPGGVCLITLNDGSGGTIPDTTLCSTNCDPTTNVGCNPPNGCALGQEPTTMKLFSLCGGASTGMQGATCTENKNCAPTFGCFGTAPDQQCLKYCAYSPASGTCPVGTACTPFTTPVILGTQEYGVCQ